MDGRTVVRIFVGPDDGVHADFRLVNLNRTQMARINILIDLLKRHVVAAFDEDMKPLAQEDQRDIDRLLDGKG